MARVAENLKMTFIFSLIWKFSPAAGKLRKNIYVKILQMTFWQDQAGWFDIPKTFKFLPSNRQGFKKNDLQKH